MTRSRFSIAASCLALLCTSSGALAHVRFVSPTPRHPTPSQGEDENIKTAPCGVANDERTTDESRVTVFEPGETITVTFAETIDHPGFYRISFDDDGQDAFDAPLSRSEVQANPTLPVLLDDIDDQNGGGYMVDVTLPNVECENCTLQLIQVMSSGQSWAADDIYYTCADIALRATGGSAGNGGVGGMAGGAGIGGAGVGGMQAGAPPVAGAGSGGVSAGAGGVSAGTGGMSGIGGSVPMGGMSAGGMSAGGSAGTAGGGAAGTLGAGGAGAGAGGITAAGGAPSAGAGAAPGTAGVAGTQVAATPEEEAGCGCSTAPTSGGARALSLLAAALLLLSRRRTRR
jgi:MYXO-CTERM domain-containing protein